jgi:predicted branched-subunit amino acid permease
MTPLAAGPAEDAPPAPGHPARPMPSPIAAAARHTAPLLAGMVPFGLVVGVTATLAQADGPLTALTSALLYAGTAEMAGFAQITAGTTALAAVVTMMIVNARLTIYAADLAPRFRRQPAWFRWFAPLFIIDQTYATSVDRAPVDDRGFRRYWLTLGGFVLIGWTTAIVLGMVIGPLLPPDLPVDAAGIACLIGLLGPRLRDRATAVTASVGALIALAAAGLPSGGGILLATVGGMAAGAATLRRAW